MSVLHINKYPDEVLKKIAEPVSQLDSNLQKLIDDMVETMYDAPGIGLAAPQVGISRQLLVVDIGRVEEIPLIVLINPEIIHSAGEVESEEGCLSIPGFNSTINRHEEVGVRGYDRNGKQIEIEAEGLLAIALQHEIDHLNGILFVDRLSPPKQEIFKKRYLQALNIPQ